MPVDRSGDLAPVALKSFERSYRGLPMESADFIREVAPLRSVPAVPLSEDDDLRVGDR